MMAESNMSDLRARLNHRRKVVRLHRLARSSIGEQRPDGDASVLAEKAELEGGQYLTFLCDDPSLDKQVRIYVAPGQRLRVRPLIFVQHFLRRVFIDLWLPRQVGSTSAKQEQDVQVAGLGITPETAIFTTQPPRHEGMPPILCVAPAAPNAQV